MEAGLSGAAEALGHARLAAAIAFVPRATIAELAGRTVSGLRQDGVALGIRAARRPAEKIGAAGARPRRSRRRSPEARPATRSVGRIGVDAGFPEGPPHSKDRDAAMRAAPIDRLEVGRAMERFIASRIAAYEASGGDDPEPEKTARTIGHYARALGLVRGYLADIEKDAETHDEAPARSLSDLRDELRRHLERIWDERGDVGGLGSGGPDAP